MGRYAIRECHNQQDQALRRSLGIRANLAAASHGSTFDRASAESTVSSIATPSVRCVETAPRLQQSTAHGVST